MFNVSERCLRRVFSPFRCYNERNRKIYTKSSLLLSNDSYRNPLREEGESYINCMKAITKTVSVSFLKRLNILNQTIFIYIFFQNDEPLLTLSNTNWGYFTFHFLSAFINLVVTLKIVGRVLSKKQQLPSVTTAMEKFGKGRLSSTDHESIYFILEQLHEYHYLQSLKFNDETETYINLTHFLRYTSPVRRITTPIYITVAKSDPYTCH